MPPFRHTDPGSQSGAGFSRYPVVIPNWIPVFTGMTPNVITGLVPVIQIEKRLDCPNPSGNDNTGDHFFVPFFAGAFLAVTFLGAAFLPSAITVVFFFGAALTFPAVLGALGMLFKGLARAPL